jgi:Peptidase family S58
MARNLITDVEGVLVGSAEDERLASGVTVVLFEEPAVASIAMNGGAPALRDTALLEPEMTIERVDGFVLSGGSAFGLDAAGGVMAYLAEIGRGFEHRGVRADRAGREPIRSPQRRQEILGPQAALLGLGLRGRVCGRCRLHARHRRSRIWGDDL